MSTRSAAPRESGVTEAFCRSRCPEHCPATTASRLHSTATGTAAQASSRPGTRPKTSGNAVHRQHRCQQSCLPDGEIAGAVRIGPGGIGIDRQHKPQVPCRECIGALFCQPGSQAPQPAPRQLAGAQQDQQHSTGKLRHSAQGSQPAARQHRQTQQAAADQSQAAGTDRGGIWMPAALYASTAEKLSMEAAAEIPNRIRSD